MWRVGGVAVGYVKQQVHVPRAGREVSWGGEEGEERAWEGMGSELLAHGKRTGFYSESRGKPLQGRGVVSALHL